MITFRYTKQNFISNSFIAIKTTPMINTLNSFGYLKSIDKKGKCIVWWYSNFIKVEMIFKMKDLLNNYKSVYPYYNTKFIRGNIWKYSYLTLLNHIHKDKGFSCIKVDKVTYKINPIKKNDIIICDARYVLSNKITSLEGKIINIVNHTHPAIYTIRTKEGNFDMLRNNFSLLPQDYFDLLSIRC